MHGTGHGRRLTARIAGIVAMLSMLGPFSIDTYLPSFPDIAAQFGAGDVRMQQTLSVYLLAFAVTTLLYGPLSDALGRRRVILGGLLLYIGSTVGCALAPGFGWFLLFRLCMGLSASAGYIVGRALVRDVFDGAQAQRVMSYVMLLFALAPALAPIIGGWLHTLAGWRSVFWFLALLGGLNALLVFAWLPETLPLAGRQSVAVAPVARGYGTLLATPRYLLLVVLLAISFAGFFLYIAGAPAVMYRHLHYGPEDFWRLFVPLVGGLMLGSFLSGRLAGRLTAMGSVSLGLGIESVAALLNLAQAHWLPMSAIGVIAPLALYAFGVALVLPGATILALDCFPLRRGMASAVQGFTQTGGNAAVAGLAVPLLGASLMSMAGGMWLFNLCALLLWGIWLWRYRAAADAFL